MTGAVFVDTNVLLYARDARNKSKHMRAQDWMRALWESGAGRLSIQVLNEFCANASAKLKVPSALARDDVRRLWAWQPCVPDETTFETAWALQDRYKLSYWDAQIVAAAHQLGCAWLLTEDLQDGQSLGSITAVNPFAYHPQEFMDQL
jgi:predicted nucleic acid-binding protein